MRNLMLLALAVVGFLCAGCGGHNYIIDDVGGVKVKIFFPSKATVSTNTKPVTDDKGNESGLRYTHTSTDGTGVKKEHVVEITNSQLTINGKGYGSIAKGDSVVIEGDLVTVNGTERGASPPPQAK